jgi:hypothetical protein
MEVALSEINARAAYTIVLTDCYDKLDKTKIDLAVQIPGLES